MATKIRLQRHGRKGKPFFHIVAADVRAKRDGRYIEKLGTYDPNVNPAIIELNFERSLDWMMKGAETTNTARAILSYKGVLMKKHLLDGIRKGAHTEAEAEKKFEAWLGDKSNKVADKKENLAKSAEDAKQKALDAETAVSDARAAAIAEANAPVPVVEEVEAVAEEPAAEAEVATEEAAPEAPAAEGDTPAKEA